MKMSKRLLSLLLTAVLLMGLLPASVLTAGAETGKTYEIKSFADLLDCAMKSHSYTFEGETIELVNDIVLTDEELQTINNTPLFFGNFTASQDGRVPFSGTFKGNGHKISGLEYSSTLAVEVSTALFAYTKGATIQDLTISDSDLEADMLGGILIGYAENTTVVNTEVSECNLSVNCDDNVLTPVTDGGLVGGGLMGKADGCTIYNCEVNNTCINASAADAAKALDGKGLYMGAMVGSATGTTIEYSRVIDGSRVKNSYDIAVGAQGGNKVYAGGIAGEIKSGTKIIDSFSTAELYTYCATYVSAGEENIGYVGGIAAASCGDNEIIRCHYAGNATGRQYNAAIVIPIMQTNKNISGLAERIKDGTLTVTGSYFRPSASPETSMKVLGDTTATAEYGPQDDVTYADRSFWAGHDYDFAGTVSRSSGYSTNHTNRWVMDYETGIPVHGQSVASGFDFPGAGRVTIGVADTVDMTAVTDDAYDFAVQAVKPADKYNVNLTAAANDNFRFVKWYRIPDVIASSAPEGHEYFAALMEQGAVLSSSSVYYDAECTDNDLFLAHMEALVQFHDINGDVIDKNDGTDSDDTTDDWYDFEQALPDVRPADCTPNNETVRLIGWTTEKSAEQGGGYSGISNVKLSELRMNGSFYQAGDLVEKPMELYPVYADLVSNVITIHEGNEQDSIDDVSRREGVGKTWVTMDENNVATIHAGGEGSTDKKLAAFPTGYRFIGWYTDDGSGNQVRISREQEYTLNGVDLTTKHTYTARFEYRVQFWLPQKTNCTLDNSDFGFSFSKKVTEIYVEYETQLFSSEWESSYINSSVYQGAPSASDDYQWKFAAWTDQVLRLNSNSSAKIYRQESSVNAYANLLASVDDIKYNIGNDVTAPLELSGLWQHPDTYAKRSAYVCTDFPYSALVEQTKVTGYDKRTVCAHMNDGYNWAFWNTYAIATNYGSTNREYADSKKQSSGGIIYSYGEIAWKTDVAAGWGNDVNFTSYYIAHNTADVNFHTATGSLIHHATVSQADFPYLTADKPVTMTRRYQSPVFGTPDNTYSGDGNSVSKDPTDYTSDKAELGTYATAEEAQIAGYRFVGWAEPSQMDDHERAYVFDISGGESADGAPQYISSSADRAKAYTLRSDALVEHTMELYPVYVPLGNITTTTNLSAAKSDSITVPDDPAYTVTETGDDGTQNIKLQADMDTPIPGGSGTCKLQRMTVSVDGGEEIKLTGDVTTGEYTYTSIEPGHSYLFTAYYLPYAVIFHQNGTEEMITQIYDQYAPVCNTPLPDVQDSIAALNNCLFAGWTEQAPENGLYLTYDAGADETVTYDKLDDIYHFVGDGTYVSHTMELWPVYINIRVQVNSSIDDELTEKSIVPDTVREVARNAEGSLQTRAVAMEVEGYKFFGWYKDIPADQLTDDSQYTAGRLVSKDSSYHITGDSLYEPTVYTARYLKVYKAVYHDQNGNVLTTDYIYEDDDHPFEKQETVTDEDGNPVTDESGNTVTVSVSYFPDAISDLYEGMTECQVFETWIWIKGDGTQVEYSDFCDKNIIRDCIGQDDAAESREMHLYPIVWTLSAKDSNNDDYRGLLLSGKFEDATDKVSAYFDGDTAYCQPYITVHIDRTEWTYAAGEAAVSQVTPSSISVTLYTDSHTGAKQLGEENTDEKGNATFNFNGALTIEKTGADELDGESFLFTVTDTETKRTQTVSLTCSVTEDGTAAAGSVTLILPAGKYSVREDSNWAYRYNAEYTVSYAVTAADSKDDYLTNTAVAVTPIGSTGAKVICTNEKKDELKGWLNDAVHNENIFD